MERQLGAPMTEGQAAIIAAGVEAAGRADLPKDVRILLAQLAGMADEYIRRFNAEMDRQAPTPLPDAPFEDLLK